MSILPHFAQTFYYREDAGPLYHPRSPTPYDDDAQLPMDVEHIFDMREYYGEDDSKDDKNIVIPPKVGPQEETARLLVETGAAPGTNSRHDWQILGAHLVEENRLDDAEPAPASSSTPDQYLQPSTRHLQVNIPEPASTLTGPCHDWQLPGAHMVKASDATSEKENIPLQSDDAEPEAGSSSTHAHAPPSHVPADASTSRLSKGKRKAVVVEESDVEDTPTVVPAVVARTSERRRKPPVDLYRNAVQQQARQAAPRARPPRPQGRTASSQAVAGPSRLPADDSDSESDNDSVGEEYIPPKVTKKARVGSSRAVTTATAQRRKKRRTPEDMKAAMAKEDANGAKLFVSCEWPANGHNCHGKKLLKEKKEDAVAHIRDAHKGIVQRGNGQWYCLWGKATIDDDQGGCQKFYQDESSLKRHIQDVHLAVKYPCPECGTPLIRAQLVDKHKRTGACANKLSKLAEAAQAQADAAMGNGEDGEAA